MRHTISLTAAMDAPGRATAKSSLKARLRRADRRGAMIALAFVAPLFVFLLATFLGPVALLLTQSVDNRQVSDVLRRTAIAMRPWNGMDVPGEAVFAALAADLKGSPPETIAVVAKTLNEYQPGLRSLMIRTARVMATAEGPSYRAGFLAAGDAWGNLETWHALRRALPAFTDHYLLAAVDLRRDGRGDVVRVEPDSAVYLDVLARTFTVSLLVTLGCLLLGYPLAFFMARSSARAARVLLLLVLLPFWTSLLVRTAAWTVVLQSEGVVNTLLAWAGLIDPAHPLALIHNRTGVLIAMIHILLPFMVLPLYSAMRAMPANYLRAASSLGAPPRQAFIRVYLPLTMSGVSAGSLLVFILALGYYITPSLVGGNRDQMVSYYIAYFANQVSNWGMAAALSAILLALVLALYIVFNRVVGIDKLRLG